MGDTLSGQTVALFGSQKDLNLWPIIIVGMNGTTAVPLALSSAGAIASAPPSGSANTAVSHVTASTSAATLAIARPTRTSLFILNTDAAITVYVGPATVTAGNGIPLAAGAGISVTWVGLVQVIAASGTPVIAIWDEYS